MGNIEMVESQYPRRFSIFNQNLSKSAKKKERLSIFSEEKSLKNKSISPIRYEHEHTPIKKYKQNTSYTVRKNNQQDEDATQTRKINQSTVKRQTFFNRSSAKNQYKNVDEEKSEENKREQLAKSNHVVEEAEKAQNRFRQNKFKCDEIIKKVKNFNDFLNEIQNKLKENDQINKQYYEENQRKVEEINSKILLNEKYEGLKRVPSRQICMALKLENQKMELEKYKNLVERQLSKNHSIENITIQNTKSGQKLLKIQYEAFSKSKSQNYQFHNKEKSNLVIRTQNLDEIQNQSKRIHSPVSSLTKQLQIQSQNLQRKLIKSLEQKRQQQNEDDDMQNSSNKIKKARQMLAMMANKVKTIEEMIDLYEENNLICFEEKEFSENDGFRVKSNQIKNRQKLIKVNSLMSRIELAQKHNLSYENQIFALLQNNKSGSLL